MNTFESPPLVEAQFVRDSHFWEVIAGEEIRAWIQETYTGMPEWGVAEDGSPVVIIPSEMD